MVANWQPLSSRRPQFQANLEALRESQPDLAATLASLEALRDYKVSGEGDRIQVAIQNGGRLEPLPLAVSATSARDIAAKLFANSQCTEPVMIAGLDQGWLWNTLYHLECTTPRTPGHRPPLYYLGRDIERLWLVMHLHDWTQMLRDPRVRLYIGVDAVQQCQQAMIAQPQIPWAKLCVTVDPSLWPGGVTVDSLWQNAHRAANERMQQLSRQIENIYAGLDIKAMAANLRGEKLRIMGITSHFTTFLKYSMSDWLDALAAMGHDTQLVMENGDHEICNHLTFGQAVVDFRPDLILMIDHYRGEIPGLPRQIPCVMWVQDQLPSIFSAAAGAAQSPRDFCLGFGRLNLGRFGYPQQRFMPAQVGVNEQRFAPRQLSASEIEQYDCDISFVSHASTPATTMLKEQLARADAQGRKLLIDIFEQMRGVYDNGGAITQPLLIAGMIDGACQRLSFPLDQSSRTQVLDFFNQRVNNALFRHQALTWVADSGAKLHLYGRGWEQHPKFAPFARGIACNQSQLCAIYRASRISLQITPHGAVHQRLFEGLSAGGFFLLRYVPGDAIESIYETIHAWCVQNEIQNDADLRARAKPEIRRLLGQAGELVAMDQFSTGWSLVDVLKLSADGGFIRSASSVWKEYDQVAFRSAEQVKQQIAHYLSHPEQRAAVAASMRQVVLDRFTYRSTSQRLLDFMADELSRDVTRASAAA
jgi:hypothetical protein